MDISIPSIVVFSAITMTPILLRVFVARSKSKVPQKEEIES